MINAADTQFIQRFRNIVGAALFSRVRDPTQAKLSGCFERALKFPGGVSDFCAIQADCLDMFKVRLC